jgi:hypothetical protein
MSNTTREFPLSTCGRPADWAMGLLRSPYRVASPYRVFPFVIRFHLARFCLVG